MSGALWTPEQDAMLRELFAIGLSFHAIALRLGVTKNSAIGRARRLNFPQRGGNEPAVAAKKAIRNERRRETVLRFPGRASTECQWPMWGNERPTHDYCHGPVAAPGEPYCPEHRKRAWTGVPVYQPAKPAPPGARRVG